MYSPAGDQLVTGCPRPSRAVTHPSSRRSPSRARSRLRRQQRDSADRLRQDARSRQLQRDPSCKSAPSTAGSTGSCSRRPTSQPSGTTSSSRGRGRRAGRQLRRVPRKRQYAEAQSVYPRVLDRRRDGWTLTDLFENIYLRQAARTSTTSSPSTRSPGPISPSRTLSTTMAQILGNSTTSPAEPRGALESDFRQSVTKAFKSEVPNAPPR